MFRFHLMRLRKHSVKLNWMSLKFTVSWANKIILINTTSPTWPPEYRTVNCNTTFQVCRPPLQDHQWLRQRRRLQARHEVHTWTEPALLERHLHLWHLVPDRRSLGRPQNHRQAGVDWGVPLPAGRVFLPARPPPAHLHALPRWPALAAAGAPGHPGGVWEHAAHEAAVLQVRAGVCHAPHGCHLQPRGDPHPPALPCTQDRRGLQFHHPVWGRQRGVQWHQAEQVRHQMFCCCCFLLVTPLTLHLLPPIFVMFPVSTKDMQNSGQEVGCFAQDVYVTVRTCYRQSCYLATDLT